MSTTPDGSPQGDQLASAISNKVVRVISDYTGRRHAASVVPCRVE